jgi:hypothetical protein
MKIIENFDNLTIKQIRDMVVKLIEVNKKLRERLAIYQEDIKHKKNPHTAQDFVDWVEGDEKLKGSQVPKI